MGLFSWCTSDTKKSISYGMDGYEGAPKKIYLLNPFGEAYEENYYGGYGEFAGQDVYALVAKWNAEEECKDEKGDWLPDDEIREIGIRLACYNEDHVQLRYPIKIVENKCAYDDADISPRCPFQGHFYPDDVEEIQNSVDEAFFQLHAAGTAYIKYMKCLGLGKEVNFISDLEFKSKSLVDYAFLTIVAKGPETPQSVLMDIAKKGDIYLAQKLVKNPNLSMETLNELKKWGPGYDYLNRMIINHPNYIKDKKSLDDQIATSVSKVSNRTMMAGKKRADVSNETGKDKCL